MPVKNLRVVALATMLMFCVQFVFPWHALAQTAPEAPVSTHFDTTTAPPPQMSVESTAEMHSEFPPTGIQPNPLPEQGSISAEMVTVLSNAVTSAGHVVIDFGALAGGVLDHGTNNFANTGTIYAISTNPEITTATIAAQNIFNQTGATITTILPEGGLTGYSNLVSGLNLSLSAVESVVNAGTISSAGNLNVTAGSSIMNALPSTLPPDVVASAPVMQATNNLNLMSANITNAGVMESVTSSINISTPTAQSIVFNNVGGTLSALDAINVRDANFAGKFDTLLLGGNILADRLNVYSGDGLAKIQVDILTPALTLLAGDGYVSTLSDLRIAKVVYTGDPIHVSGGDVIFESDEDENGNKTGIVTGGGTFSGANARIGEGVHTINISGAIIDLSGSANLSTLPISVASSLKINAAGSINTSSIGAGSAIILVSSGGNVRTGTLNAGDFIQIQAAGDVSTGSLTSNAGGVIVHGKELQVGNITSRDRPGFVDIKAQSNQMLVVGGGNIGRISMSGTSPTGEAWVNIDNPNGVMIVSPAAVSIDTSRTFSGLSINAQNGTVILPQGTMTFRGGNFAVSAVELVANGTTIDTSNPSGPGGLIFLGATTIDRGAGLTLNTNGTNNLNSGIGIGGKESVRIVTQLSGSFNQRNVSYSGTVAAPFLITGSGPLIATSNGTVNGGNIFIDSLSSATFEGGRVEAIANGVGQGNGGFVQLFNNYIVNNISDPQGIKLSANGAGVGRGGFVQARADMFDADLVVNSDRGLRPQVLTLSATSGATGGNGGTVDIKAGRMLSVDPAAITTGTIGTGNGNAQRLTLVGGTSGLNGGGITFLNGGTLSNDGKGTGFGGLTQLGAFGNDSDVNLSTQTGAVNISVKGGVNGSGGTVQSDAGRSINLGSANIDASAGSAQGNGGNVVLTARLPANGGLGSYSQAGSIIANGAGTGSGGFVWVRGPNMSIGNSASFAANGGSGGSGGTVVVQSGSSLNLPASVSASAGSQSDGAGGLVQIDAGFATIGDLTVSGAVKANGGSTGTGGFITSHAFSGAYTVTSTGSLVADGRDGGVVLAQAIGSLSNAGLVSASGTSNGGTVQLDAGLGGSGALSVSGTIAADGSESGSIFLSSPESITGGASSTFKGEVNAFAGSGIDLRPAASSTTLTIGTLQSASGDISLVVSDNSTIDLPNPITVDAFGGNVLMEGGAVLLGSGTGELGATVTGDGLVVRTTGANEDQILNTNFIFRDTIVVETTGTGNIVHQAGRLQAPTITLRTANGSIGTESARVTTNAETLTITAVGDNSNAFVSNDQSVSLQASRAGQTFDLAVSGNLTISEALTANDITLATNPNADVPGDITIAAVVTGGNSIQLNAGGRGSIIQGQNGALVSGGTLNLRAANNIGTSDARIVTRGSELSFNVPGVPNDAASGNVFISQEGSLRLGVTTVARTFDMNLNDNSSLSIARLDSGLTSIRATDLTIRTRGTGGFDVGGATITGTDSVTLQAQGSGNIVQTGQRQQLGDPNNGVITGNLVQLITTTGRIGDSRDSRVETNATILGARTSLTGGGGDVFIFQRDDVQLGNSSSGNHLDILVDGDIATTRGVSGTHVRLETTATSEGSIAMGGSVTGVVDVVLKAGTNGDILWLANADGTPAAGRITAAAVSLETNAGNIGSQALPVQLNAERIAAGTSTQGNGSVFLNNVSNLPEIRVFTGLAGNQFVLRSNNNIKLDGEVRAAAPTFITPGQVINDPDIVGTQSLTIIADSGIVNLFPDMYFRAPIITLATVSGDIGSAELPILTDAGTLNISSTSGSMHIVDVDSLILTATSTTGEIHVSAGTSLTLSGNVSGSSLRFTAQNGQLMVNEGIALNATNGNLILQSSNTSIGAISIGTNVSLTARSSADPALIAVVIGDVPLSPITGTAPNTVTATTSNGGQIYFGANGISAVCCSNISADAATIIFDTKQLPATAIQLESGVNMGATTASGLPLPPGHGGTPPGQGGKQPPGLNGVSPPGQGGTPPGQGGLPPGQTKPTDVTPPGLRNNPAHEDTSVPKQKKAQSAQTSHFTPVSFVQSAAPRFSEFRSAQTPTAELRQMGNSEVIQLGDRLVLEAGELLVHATQSTTVQAGEASVSLRPKATVLLIQSASGTTIWNLADGGAQDVVVTIAGLKITVGTGEQMQVGQTQINVAQRRMQHLGENLRRSEFSVVHLLKESSTMHALRLSERKQDKSIMGDVLKMAACLMKVTASHGPYSGIR